MPQYTQAYERLTIFLERIKPAYVIQNFDKQLAPHEFLYLVEKYITEEYMYNISQQIYVKKYLWEELVDAKDKVLSLLRETYEQLDKEASLEEYKTIFLMKYMQQEDLVSQIIDKIRQEIKNK